MKEIKKHILAYNVSRKIEDNQLQDLAGAGVTTTITGQGGASPGKGIDGSADVILDYNS